MKRKVISMILCAMMAVSMIGCGSSDDKANDSTPPAETGGTETSGSETGAVNHQAAVRWKRLLRQTALR